MSHSNPTRNWSYTGRRIGVQLAYPLEEKRLLKWTPPYLIQPKYDGDRCRAVTSPDGHVTLYSSEAKEILTVPHINQALERLRLLDTELDGELYIHGVDQATLNGVLHTSDLHPMFEDVTYNIFDIVDEFAAQAARLSLLNKYRPLFAQEDSLVVAPYTIAETWDDIMKALDWSIERGFEGIIVRHLDAPYIRRRSIYMMKFKPRREDSYEIVGVTQGLGKYADCLGALICRSHDSEEVFNVGSGFTDDERRELWKIRECLPGLRVTVKYQHLTSARGVPRSAVLGRIEWPKE